jgi:hypothetical protein
MVQLSPAWPSLHHNTSKDHLADLSFVACVADHWLKLPNVVTELTVVSIRACATFLPFVIELSLEHPLVVHNHLKRLFLFLPSSHKYLLRIATHTKFQQ